MLVLASANAPADEFPDDEVQRALRVNEGNLVFLAQPPAKPVHHHRNRIAIDENSLDSGWVTLDQCHENLDVFERVEIVFDETRVSDLRVVSASEIGIARAEGASVQLQDVRAGARLCIALRSRALWREGREYELRNGPYMRKFLDGYYPMHVTMEVRYPAQRMRYRDVVPVPQPGFSASDAGGVLAIDAWFEGRLTTRVRFSVPEGAVAPER
jgi:hypothetical protein